MSGSGMPERSEADGPARGKDMFEQRRLAALRRYDAIDTPPEAGFDQITTLAAEVFGVPIALVNLVAEDTQFSKSCYGIDVRTVDRQVSFCTHTIQSNEVMVVLDATIDDRFETNPLVTGTPNIRFYAGAPLRTPDGENIGALCIIDDEPRAEFSERDQALLEIMARMAMDEFELRLANHRAHDELQRRLELERDNERLIAELEQKANFDSLTGLANRSLMNDRLAMAIADAKRSKSTTCVILMDLDNFKAVNDTYGHSAGDRLLKTIANRLKDAMRGVDTIARLGGDEFVVIAQTTTKDEAETIATRINAALDGGLTPEASSSQVSFSMGISMFPEHADEAEELLRMADIAMYEAKHAGKNTYRFYDPEMESVERPAYVGRN